MTGTGAVGVVDLGSNSTNLLVVDGNGHDVERTVAITGCLVCGVASFGRTEIARPASTSPSEVERWLTS